MTSSSTIEPARGATFSAIVLLFGNFVIGLSVLMPAGMLVPLADGLGVSLMDAGLLVTFGSIVLCIGSPLVAWATTHIDRRSLLATTVLIVAIGHGVSAFSPNYTTLLVLRVLLLAVAAVFTPQAAGTIAQLVPARQRASAIAFVFVGWSLSVAAGLPLVTYLAVNFGWREAYGVIALFGIVAFALILRALPKKVEVAPLSLGSWGVIARNHRIVLLLLVTMLATSGQFTLFVYLGPTLSSITGAGPHVAATFFAVSGILGLIGGLAGTRIVSAIGAFRTSVMFLASMAIGLLLFTLGGASIAILMAGMVLLGWGFIGANSMQQARLAAVDPSLASATIALNSSALYVGQAVGGWLGGILVTHGLAHELGLICAVFMAGALVFAFLTRVPGSRD